jgi:hypothetical protein
MSRSVSRRGGVGVLVGLILAGASCTGTIGETSRSGSTSTGGNTGGTGSGTGGGPGGTLDCTSTQPGPSFVRRLNRFEYNNTVRDLLGDSTQPADGFPTEEKRNGFDNQATALQISPALVEQYLNAAEKLATTAVSNITALLPCDPVKDGEDACGKAFISAFGAKAFRHPLATDESARLWGVFDAGRKLTDFTTGIRLVVETVLQSPQFLYRVEFGTPPGSGEMVVKLTSWEMASRLSYLLWQSMPDEALRTAAQQDALTTKAAIAAQVDRMLADPKARTVVAHFNDLWLHLDQYETIEKDAQVFTTFTPDLVPLMAEETHRFLDHLIWDGEGDVNSLLSAPYSFMNAKLAGYYGVTGPTGPAFVKVDLDPAQHAGLLTQGGILSVLAKANQTGPVQRGKFVREQLLCTELPPPPPDIMIKPPDLSPTLSTRDRFAAHRSQASCSACHQLMDPIGLTLENYDGAGRYRATENGNPIDVSGEIVSSDVTGPFEGARGLAQKLAASARVKSCVARSWFRYAYGRAETSSDACTLALADQKFKDGGYKIKDIIVALTQTDAFLYRPYIAPGGAQ